MQIRPEQLEAQLARELKALYTIHGDEPLQAKARNMLERLS